MRFGVMELLLHKVGLLRTSAAIPGRSGPDSRHVRRLPSWLKERAPAREPERSSRPLPGNVQPRREDSAEYRDVDLAYRKAPNGSAVFTRKDGGGY
jgi:hypothetical protein